MIFSGSVQIKKKLKITHYATIILGIIDPFDGAFLCVGKVLILWKSPGLLKKKIH